MGHFWFRVFVAACMLGAIDAFPAAASAQNTATPELMKLQAVWNGVSSYSEFVSDHEVTNDGKNIADRTFAFKLLKPSLIQIDVLGGPGKGGGAVWHGGETIKGHPGGFLAGIHLAIRKDDARAKTLRGDEIDTPSIGWQIQHVLNTPGVLTDGKSETGFDTITLVPTVPEGDGVTREVLEIDPQTHLTARRMQFVGTTLVKAEVFSDIKINPGLTEKDFDPA